MNPAFESKVSVSTAGYCPRWLDWILRGLFLSAVGFFAAKTIFAVPELQHTNAPEICLLLTATAAIVSSVSRTLPFQNVLWAALVIGGIGGLSHTVGTLASIPFGPFAFMDSAGGRLGGFLPWIIPFLWIVFVFASRGVARLILQRARDSRYFGFWLIGVAALLSVILDVGFDPWASGLKHFWIWESIRFPLLWCGTPITNFLGWFVTSAVAATFIAPMLIHKKPGPMTSEYGSLLIWISLNALFAGIALDRGFRIAFGFSILAMLAVVMLVWNGVRGRK
ncbi:MAG TPA: carotenoid biosynthesis protein [Verrucomicrobiae bacterium]|nr:carotenoid biosynthesis protein [Verrucomicrobiae bacterium]